MSPSKNITSSDKVDTMLRNEKCSIDANQEEAVCSSENSNSKKEESTRHDGTVNGEEDVCSSENSNSKKEESTRHDGTLNGEEDVCSSENSNSKKEESTRHDGTLNGEEDALLDGNLSWLIAVGTAVISALICSLQSTFGIMFSRPLLDMNASSTTIFWIFNLFNVLYNLMGIFVEPLVQVLGWRILGMGAASLVSLAFIISSFATSPYFLIFSFSIIGGIGSGLSLSITHTISPHYFKKYLGVANAFPMGGACVGGFIMPPVIQYLLDEYAYRGTMLILAALILNSMVGAALFQLPEWQKKKKYKAYFHSQQKNGANNNDDGTHSEHSLSKNTDISKDVLKAELTFSEKCFQILQRFYASMKILQNTRVIIIALGSGLYINSVINFFMFVPFYLQEAGHSLETSAWLVSASSVMNFIARMVCSMLSDYKWFNKRICYIMGLALCTISILSFSYTTDVVWCTILLAVFGTGFGSCFSMYSLVMVEYMGVNQLGATYGASSFMITSGFLTIGPLLGYVRDISGSFSVTFGILGAMCTTTICLWLIMPKAVIYDACRIKPEDNSSSV